MGRVLLAVATLLAMAVAGCAEDSGPAPATTEDEEKFEEIEVTENTGAIRGLVLTETITPIADATVTVLGTGDTKTTNEDGAFTFSGLEPGTYFVEAAKLGFNSTQTSVQVQAGVERPDIVKMVLPADPSSRPEAELQQWTGYLQCGAGLGPVVSTNPCAFTGSDNVHDFGVKRKPDYTQVEMIWEGTNVLGNTLSIGMLRPGTISNFAGVDSGSPAIFGVDGDTMASEYGEGFDIYTIRVFPGTENGETVSVVAEQSFDVFTTNFYGFTPDEGWAFVNDGPHPLPQ